MPEVKTISSSLVYIYWKCERIFEHKLYSMLSYLKRLKESVFHTQFTIAHYSLFKDIVYKQSREPGKMLVSLSQLLSGIATALKQFMANSVTSQLLEA